MRILVTGSNGQLGRCIRDVAKASVDEYIFTDADELDITDSEAVELCLKVNRFDIIVNCAAYTNVEQAEQQEDIALRINGHAVGNLAKAARSNEVFLIHISTDYVFDGHGNKPIGESHVTAPLNAYGRTKLVGEEEIKQSGCNAIILRTSWLYSEYGSNFVKTMLRFAADGRVVNVVADQVGTPTYAGDLAKAIVSIIEQRAYKGREGVYHYSNEGLCSWFDVARMTAEFADKSRDCIRPCSSDEYPTVAERPTFSVLDKTRFKTTFGLEIPYWTDSLRKCVYKLKQKD